MKIKSVLAAAALVAGFAAVTPASAQFNPGGIGDARQRDLPSSVGALNEGRSYYGYRRAYRPYGFRPYGYRPFRPFYRPYGYRPRFYRGY